MSPARAPRLPLIDLWLHCVGWSELRRSKTTAINAAFFVAIVWKFIVYTTVHVLCISRKSLFVLKIRRYSLQGSHLLLYLAVDDISVINGTKLNNNCKHWWFWQFGHIFAKSLIEELSLQSYGSFCCMRCIAPNFCHFVMFYTYIHHLKRIDLMVLVIASFSQVCRWIFHHI